MLNVLSYTHEKNGTKKTYGGDGFIYTHTHTHTHTWIIVVYHECTHMSKLTELYALIMCSFWIPAEPQKTGWHRKTHQNTTIGYQRKVGLDSSMYVCTHIHIHVGGY